MQTSTPCFQRHRRNDGGYGQPYLYGCAAYARCLQPLGTPTAHRTNGAHVVVLALIFAAVFLVFSYRAEFARVWDRVSANLSPRPSVSADGSVRIPKSPDGHFWVTASVNGKPVRFMVDSGATVTSMSAQASQKAGVDLNAIGFPALVQTANGMIEMRRARIKSFAVETIQREDMAVLVSDALGDTNLLGMNFLSSLNGWRIEGEEMILNP